MIRVHATDFNGWSCMDTPLCVYRIEMNDSNLYNAVLQFMQARGAPATRTTLRNLAVVVGYVKVPAETTKMKVIKDWTEEIDSKFLTR